MAMETPAVASAMMLMTTSSSSSVKPRAGRAVWKGFWQAAARARRNQQASQQ